MKLCSKLQWYFSNKVLLLLKCCFICYHTHPPLPNQKWIGWSWKIGPPPQILSLFCSILNGQPFLYCLKENANKKDALTYILLCNRYLPWALLIKLENLPHVKSVRQVYNYAVKIKTRNPLRGTRTELSSSYSQRPLLLSKNHAK